VKNYGQFLEDIRGEFAFLTLRYGKNISEEWSNALLERFRTRINVIVMRLLEKKQNEI
jgi:hypothetical protein